MKHRIAQLALLGLFCSTQTAHSQERTDPAPPEPPAIQVKGIKDPDLMSYRSAYARMQEFDGLKAHDRIYLRFFIKINQDKVKMSDLQLNLTLPDSNLPLEVEPDGTLSLPYSEAANASKADILVNQRSGTISIYYGPGIKVPEHNSFHYRELMDGVKQSSRMMKSFWNFLFPSFIGAGLRYSEADGQFVTIQTKRGDQKIMIDPQRKSIPVTLDDDLYEENPMVVVSQKPMKILPFNVAP